MPIPEDRLYNSDRLNRWFAVASVLMTASLFWMIWIDYDRPWKAFQDDYYAGKAALAHLEYLDATREERRQEIKEARERVKNAKELNRTKTAKIIALDEELVQAGLKFRVVGGQWSREKQLLDVVRDTYEKMLNRHGAEHSKARDAHKLLTDGEEEVEDLRKQKEKWEDKQASIEAELDELNATVRKAEKHLVDLEAVASDALKKDQSFRGVLTDEGLLASVPVVRAIINTPLLDFMSPKLTPARHDVKQLVLPNIRQRLNYLETYTTDRCTTCHIAIDDPAFGKDRLARTLERAIPAINEARQRNGDEPFDLPAAPIIEGQDKPLPAGRVTDHWEKLSKEQ
ncbi:MAG: hypothetical protein IID33_16680, partial [Planctomycetes bacterium]|nr:hypothetical protein [Planctomycetota bacterium]